MKLTKLVKVSRSNIWLCRNKMTMEKVSLVNIFLSEKMDYFKLISWLSLLNYNNQRSGMSLLMIMVSEILDEVDPFISDNM